MVAFQKICQMASFREGSSGFQTSMEEARGVWRKTRLSGEGRRTPSAGLLCCSSSTLPSTAPASTELHPQLGAQGTRNLQLPQVGPPMHFIHKTSNQYPTNGWGPPGKSSAHSHEGGTVRGAWGVHRSARHWGRAARVEEPCTLSLSPSLLWLLD